MLPLFSSDISIFFVNTFSNAFRFHLAPATLHSPHLVYNERSNSGTLGHLKTPGSCFLALSAGFSAVAVELHPMGIDDGEYNCENETCKSREKWKFKDLSPLPVSSKIQWPYVSTVGDVLPDYVLTVHIKLRTLVIFQRVWTRFVLFPSVAIPSQTFCNGAEYSLRDSLHKFSTSHTLPFKTTKVVKTIDLYNFFFFFFGVILQRCVLFFF